MVPIIGWAQIPVVPVLNKLFPDLDKSPGDAEERFMLASHFGAEQIRDTAVRLEAEWTLLDGTEESSDIDFLLFRERTPITIANFLGYVNRRDYTNMIVHRLVPGFVIQGGGFTIVNGADGGISADSVATQPTIRNEFGVSNTLGTISMAKLGGNPDSATSQWFISTGANSDNLDSQNGGFTVFGVVSRDSFEAALELDRRQKFTIYDLGGALGSTPLVRNTNNANFTAERFYRFSSVVEVPLPDGQAGTDTNLSYSLISGSEEGDPVVEISEGELVVGFPSATFGGKKTVIVQAEDSVGNTVVDTFKIVMEANYESWRKAVFPAEDVENDLLTGPAADFNGDGVDNLMAFVHGLNGNINSINGLGGPSLVLGLSTVGLELKTGLIEGINFGVEVSTDGKSWVATESAQTTKESANGRTELFTVARPDEEDPQSFYRLRYTLN
jgi:cyclophilin family peptidyl-prolyl cis-trans isomerase